MKLCLVRFHLRITERIFKDYSELPSHEFQTYTKLALVKGPERTWELEGRGGQAIDNASSEGKDSDHGPPARGEVPPVP